MPRGDNSHVGGIMRGVRERMKAAGIAAETIEAVVSGSTSKEPPRVPRKVVKRLARVLGEHGQAVVTWRAGNFRVFSMEGYKTTGENVDKALESLGRKRHVKKRGGWKNKPKYDQAFIDKAVAKYQELRSMGRTAKALGIGMGTLHGWVHRAGTKPLPVGGQLTVKKKEPVHVGLTS